MMQIIEQTDEEKMAMYGDYIQVRTKRKQKS